MNILVIAPHPDDEAIGCGGTLCNHAAHGERVVVVFLTSGELGLKQLSRDRAWMIRESEAARSQKILGISALHFLRLPDWYVDKQIRNAAKFLRPILKQEKPGMIYVTHPAEWHPDHKAGLSIVRAAFRGSGLPVPAVRAYEVWTPITEPHHIEDVTKTMSRKLRAIRAHRSQFSEIDYARAVQGLNQYRGEMSMRFRYAEVFQNFNVTS
jgi:LmbE family N-acetylglucosaminyl deacetylase